MRKNVAAGGGRPNPLDFFTEAWRAGRLSRAETYGPRYENTINAMRRFMPALAWEDFTPRWAYGFDTFLSSGYGCRAASSRAGHHKRARRMIRQAIAEGLLDAGRDPYLTARFPQGRSERTALTREEVARLEALRLPAGRGGLFVARDLFLFSCYCGLRFSDTLRVRPSLLDAAGVLRVRMGKVDREVVLPLRQLFNGRPLAILARYLVAGSDAPCFPQLSNVSVNRDLKELARLARIEKKLTFHVARHTFGTRLAERVHDPYVILALMGHTSVKTSMIYIHQSGASVAERLNGVEW